MARGKTTPEPPTTEPLPQQSTVDVDVEHESHGHTDHDVETTRHVDVDRDTDINWEIDYGGDPVHPTSISSEGYTLPPVQPESD